MLNSSNVLVQQYIMQINQNYKKDLLEVLVGIADLELMDAFLHDLLTPGEYSDIITRLQIVRQLDAKVPQREIAQNLGVSISKVTRGSRELLNAHGGFRKILDQHQTH